jgi:hypothetical protein
MITLKLAHPLTAEQAARLRATEVQDYPNPGMEITVPREEARAIIDAGYASGVEPQDQDAVSAVLNPAPEPTDTPPTASSAMTRTSPEPTVAEPKSGSKRSTSS